MIHIIYLAAGKSERFGENKLLYKLNEKPLFLYGLDVLKKVQASRTDCTLTVVTRYDEIAKAAEKLKINFVISHDSEKGISYSIKAGLDAINIKINDYILFMTADQPKITVGTVIRLIDSAKQEPLTACISYKDNEGNPAMFSYKLISELYSLEGDFGGRKIIKKHPENHITVKCDSKEELDDIDTKNDAEIYK